LIKKNNIFNKKGRTDVWELRYEALYRKLTKKEFARVLTHIAKRRGYKSNRKVEEKGNKESKKVLGAIEENKKLFANYLTAGEAIYKTTQNTKIRRNKKDDYKHSISRAMLVEEINVIFEKQREFYSEFTSKEFQDSYIKLFLKQRDFASVDGMIGKCTFEKSELRAPKRAYSSEEFVTLTKILNIKLFLTDGKERIFSKDELKKIIELCKLTEQPTYKKLREYIKLDAKVEFKNLDYNKFDEKTGELIKIETKEKFKSGFVGFHSLRIMTENILSKLHWQNISQDVELLDEIAKIFSHHKSDKKIEEELKKLVFKTLNENEKSLLINNFIENIHFDKFLHLSLKAIKNYFLA